MTWFYDQSDRIWVSHWRSCQWCCCCKMLRERWCRGIPWARRVFPHQYQGRRPGLPDHGRGKINMSTVETAALLPSPKHSGPASAPGQGPWNNINHDVKHLVFCFSFSLLSSCPLLSLFHPLWITYMTRSALPRRHRLCSPGRLVAAVSYPHPYQHKEGLSSWKEKRGCPLQELIEIEDTRCCGSYFSGRERNSCSLN